MNGVLAILFCAIRLSGVTGSDLKARTFFDANNVKVGDPMVLTIDFLGTADFKDLHPPALSRLVNRKDWKVDDVSAKTDTFRDARRLTYRVRPMREGVLWFPSLEFVCEHADGGELKFRSNDVPVHAKVGAQVAMGEIGAEEAEPDAPAVIDLLKTPDALGDPGVVSDDLLFAWRKACAHPTADGFAAFDFPAARYNEAACAIREGNWARARTILQKLEWRVGQTPEIERALVAALALRYDNPSVELPMWRQVLRPVLKYPWVGRVSIVLGGFAALALLFWLLGRGIRAVACVAFVAGFACTASAQDIFRQMEEQMNRMHQQMQQSFGNFGGLHFGTKERREPTKVMATVEMSKKHPQVGESFEFIISLEYPRTASVGQIGIRPSEMFGLTVTGQAQNMTDGKSVNPTNVVKRLAVPVRYDVPFKGKLVFAIEGMVSGRESRRGGMFSFSFSNSFTTETDPIDVEIRPLPTAGQPKDYTGIVSDGLRVHETCDILRLETNDVVQITYRLYPKGYVPKDFLPKDVAFEWVRENDREGRVTEIEYRRFFVADGAPKTPEFSISYYDPRAKTYRTAKTGGTTLTYVSQTGK